MKKGKEYEFYIEKTQFPGTGIANQDGIKVRIKNGVPGQKVLARVTKREEIQQKQKYWKS